MDYKVYIIQMGNKSKSPVKIGLTKNIHARMEAMQTSSPYPLVCKGLIPCKDKQQAFKLEAHIHRRLKSFRMQGEWFRNEFHSLKKILNDFDSKSTTPIKIEVQKFTHKKDLIIKELRQENKILKVRVAEFEEEIEQMLDEQTLASF